MFFLALGAGLSNSAYGQTTALPDRSPSPSCPCTLLPPEGDPVKTDAGPDNPVELGVKFYSDIPGLITGIRFFKSERNIGVHTGSLWTSDGTLLARVTFTAETESGWQVATFAAPVSIAPQTTYVASYHTHAGHYAFSRGFFASRIKSDGPLHAVRGPDSANGVFRYGLTSEFPDASLNSPNYWVDVLFVQADDSGAPAAVAPQPDSVAVQIVDSTISGLSNGTLADAIITDIDDGEIMLAPVVGSEFAGTTMPAGWRRDLWNSGGSTQFTSGAAQIDGAKLGADATFGPGRSLEFDATFAGTPNQHVGYGISFAGGPWAIFSSFTGDGLYARSSDGSRPLDTRLDGDWIGKPHRFRIDWSAKSIAFWIDGSPVVTHPVAIARKMRVLASDLNADGAALTLGWVRLTPYTPRGSFTSRVLDGGGTVSWSTAAWEGDEPTGTRVVLTVRTGNTPNPDATWTPFSAVPTTGGAFATSRYIQYQLQLDTTTPDASPVVRQVIVSGSPVTF